MTVARYRRALLGTRSSSRQAVAPHKIVIAFIAVTAACHMLTKIGEGFALWTP